MGFDTKHAIRDTARRLFSEQGYQNTSMRDIAEALNISVGNLTYHYKKKEALIEAILLEDHKKYHKSAPPLTLKDFERLLQKILVQKNRRPYYFRHFTQLSQISPAIYRQQVSVLQNFNDILIKSLENFENSGILKKEFSHEYPRIANVILSLIAYGLPDLGQMQEHEKNQFWLDCVWSIILPCLTEQGQREYQSLIESGQIKQANDIADQV